MWGLPRAPRQCTSRGGTGVVALSAATGATVWAVNFTYGFSLGVPVPLTLFGDVLVVNDAHIQARDAMTGALLWSVLSLGHVILGATSDAILVQNQVENSSGSYLQLSLFDGTTGAQRWHSPRNYSCAYDIGQAVVLANGRFAMVNFDGDSQSRHVVDLANGSVVWSVGRPEGTEVQMYAVEEAFLLELTNSPVPRPRRSSPTKPAAKRLCGSSPRMWRR